MLKKIEREADRRGALLPIREASFPSPFVSGLEYSSPARGTWNIVHTGMLIPEAHEIFVCPAGCLRGVVLTAAEMGMADRFSTVVIRDNNLLDGDLEELFIDGVSHIIEKLPKCPPAVLVYTSCVHHFAGCDLTMMYRVLRERYPHIDFMDFYMNPIMRKSGLTPDQLARKQLYALLKERELNPRSLAIIGNDLPTDEDSDLIQLIRSADMKLHEITSCSTYAEYEAMAESSYYVSYYPAAKVGGDALAGRLGGKHLYLPFTLNYDEIEKNLTKLADAIGVLAPDFSGKRVDCKAALTEARELIGDTPIAIDYTAVPKPLGLARLLLDSGFAVRRVYADTYTPEEKTDFDYLKSNYPNLELYATVHAKMRFLAGQEDEGFLAIGQKAAHFTGTNHFVNIVEGDGMYGFQAIVKLCGLMKDAYLNEKNMRELIQIKGMGWGCCS